MGVDVGINDVSTRPLAAMRMERDRFVALAFCWADLLFELDAEAKVVYAAGAVEALIGRRSQQLIGQSFHTLIAHQDRPLVADLVTIARKHGRVENARVRLLGHKGPTAPLALAGYCLDDLSGHYFLALHIGESTHGSNGSAPLVRDEDTRLYDAESFTEMVTRQLVTIGGDSRCRMSLILLPDYDVLRERLSEGAEQELLSALGACLRANSLDGEAAGRLGVDR